ncbi:uncharacterized protein FOMMEDRAFT_157957 [Fomitiporia mediterranea MF3/22]|uniref:uncharacterized protein n=1 Tax=Fomitiporia mediterranea (strain MF3/22) TaxID=694068 RepID=UPI00044072CE|nr:uncharacterized protein FOMMEDRAFT_157957 [Fomitiporia mediterranea MF3/22]EJD00847.1 hypothetical protein FOMMEDRAFT_157957 [Fomitiporia mediterranea MF3/22]
MSGFWVPLLLSSVSTLSMVHVSVKQSETTVGTDKKIGESVKTVIPLVHGLILLALALAKARTYLKLASGFKGFRLVKILVQD